jgi:5,10-methylenetetrahydromethanopterin reductase
MTEESGRGVGRVIAMLPVWVTHDRATASGFINERFAHTSQMPSYRAMLDREGVQRASDIAVCGDEDQVMRALLLLKAVGVTDLVAIEIARTGEERSRTRAVLAAFAANE